MQANYDIIKANEKEAYAIAESKHAEKIINSVNTEEIDRAEREFSELIKLITDIDLRMRIDMSAGKISRAYEKRGFVAGYIAEKAIKCKG